MEHPVDLPEFLLARARDLENAIETEVETHGPLFAPPAVLLGLCAAIRRIVDLHAHEEGCGCLHNDQGHQFGCSICHFDQGYVLSAGWCDTLLALARPFADHPDFDSNWTV